MTARELLICTKIPGRVSCGAFSHERFANDIIPDLTPDSHGRTQVLYRCTAVLELVSAADDVKLPYKYSLVPGSSLVQLLCSAEVFIFVCAHFQHQKKQSCLVKKKKSGTLRQQHIYVSYQVLHRNRLGIE